MKTVLKPYLQFMFLVLCKYPVIGNSQRTYCDDLYDELENAWKEHEKRCRGVESDCCEDQGYSLKRRVQEHKTMCSHRASVAGKCNKKTDLIIVIDRSGSVRPSDYDRMRKFLKVVGDALQIGVRNEEGDVIGQGAIVTFSEEGTIRLTLEQSQREGLFARVVQDSPGPLLGGRTKTHLGLKIVDEVLAQKEQGFRENDPDVERILMVITDGEQTKARGYVPVKEAIKPFFKRDMTVFAVGVGLRTQGARDEISDMVEDSKNAIFAQSYSDLINSVNEILLRFCPSIILVKLPEL